MDLSHFQNFLLSQKNPPAKNTVKNYLADIKHFVTWFETTYQKTFEPSKITSSDIEQFTHFLETVKYHPSTIERHISSLRKFFQFLLANALIPQNPLENGPVPEGKDPYHLELFQRFLYSSGREKNTIKNYVADLENFFAWLDKIDTNYDISTQAKIGKITTTTISEYKNRLLSIAKLSPSSINRKLSSMRLYCQWAKEEGYLKEDPFDQPTFGGNLLNEGKQTLPQPDVPVDEFFNQQGGYSKIPPVRLAQKVGRFTDRFFITSLVAPVVNTFGNLQDKSSPKIGRYVKSEFYAPVHKRNTLLHPHFVVLLVSIVLTALVAGLVYQRFSVKTPQKITGNPPIKEEEVKQNGFPFSGRLADKKGNPVTTTSTVIFSFYNDPASFDKVLHQEVLDVMPDNQGFFTVTLENVPQALLSTTTPVYLGTAIQGDSEMRPRQLINPQSVAVSSLFGSEEGTMTLPNQSPTIAAPAGPLTLTASQIVLKTTEESNGSIVLWPDGVGKIDVLSPLTNSITGKVEVNDALAVNASGTTDAFLVQIAGTPVFTIDNQGSFSVGGGQFGGSVLPSRSDVYNLGSSLERFKTVYADNVIATSSGIQGYWQRNAGAISPSNISDDLLIGGIATSSATFRVARANGNITTSGDIGINGGDITSSTALTITPNAGSNLNIALSDAGDFVVNAGQLYVDTSTNNVGIGATAPGATLQINGNTVIGFGSSTVAGPTNGLAVSGNVGIGTTSPVTMLDVAGGGRFNCASNFSNAGGVTSCSDVAEVYSSDENLERGDVLRITTIEQKVGKTTKAYDGVIGVYSTSPGVLVGGDARIGGGNEVSLPQGKIPVALIGRVPTKVSTENGAIAVGDYLTSSSIPGIAMKATKAGPVLGKALESFAPDSNICNLLPETCPQGKILVFINVSWYEPDVAVTNLDNFSLVPIDISEQLPRYTVYDAVGELVKNVSAYSDLIIGNLTAGKISAQFAQIGKLIVTVLQVNDVQVTHQIISPLAEIDRIRTNVISPLASDTIIVDGRLSVTQQVTTNNLTARDASVSGELTAHKVSSQELAVSSDASISGTLRVGKLIADNIVSLQAQIATIAAETLSSIENKTASESSILNTSYIIPNTLNIEASSSATLHIDTFYANKGSFLEGLLAIGPAGFSDVSISGILSLGPQFILSDNSINVLEADLKLQPLGQGGVSIADGKVYIDSTGNLTVLNNVRVGGTLETNIISPIPNQDLVIKLNNPYSSFVVHDSSDSAVLQITQQGDIIASGSAKLKQIETQKLTLPEIMEKVNASGQTETSNGSVGKGAIPAGFTEVTIESPMVTDHSLIYISPTSGTAGMVPYLARQIPQTSFTIAIQDTTKNDITFNWWIIN